jgi:hypothetical protein
MRAKPRLLLCIMPCAVALGSACEPARDQIFTWESGATPVAGAAGSIGGRDAGGSGGTGGSDAGPGSGVAGTAPGLDPSSVFEWTGTPPSADSCKPSNFNGKFNCELSTKIFSKIEGSLKLTFVGASEAQMLTSSDGELTAFDESSAMVLVAPVDGTLDCTTHEVVGEVQRTQTEVLPLDRQLVWVVLTEQPFTTGMLRGTFDPRAQTINGDLTLMLEPSTVCVGTFSLRASPG